MSTKQSFEANLSFSSNICCDFKAVLRWMEDSSFTPPLSQNSFPCSRDKFTEYVKYENMTFSSQPPFV